MLREALEWISEHSKPKLEEIGGLTYSSKNLNLITKPMASPLKVSTLSGFVDYICNDPDTEVEPPTQPFVLIEPARVSLVRPLMCDTRQREKLLVAEPHPIGRWIEDQYLPAEDFNIMLQSCCLDTKHRDQLLSVCGHLAEQSEVSTADDGVSQKTTVKTGIQRMDNKDVPNPVTLQPFCTFNEVQQPERPFVVRMRSDRGIQIMLTPCDGGAWKNKAIENIHTYLKERIDLQIIS